VLATEEEKQVNQNWWPFPSYDSIVSLTYLLKVYYIAKTSYDKRSINPSTNYTESYIRLPDLFYVPDTWTDEERDAWMRSPHGQRLDLLNARRNMLPVQLGTIPITLCYEMDDYQSIVFYGGLASTILYYNLQGAMYLGVLEDMGPLARYIPGNPPNRPRYLADKADFAPFKVWSGHQAVAELAIMYFQERPDTVVSYGAIVTKSTEAHPDWAQTREYTVEGIACLGPQEDRPVEIAQARSVHAEGGHQLRNLLAEPEPWPPNLSAALADYTAAANAGVEAVSRFMVWDENWAGLSTEEKNKIVDVWGLEQEVAERVTRSDEAEDSSSEEERSEPEDL
jgi:hypothetical protein